MSCGSIECRLLMTRMVRNDDLEFVCRADQRAVGHGYSGPVDHNHQLFRPHADRRDLDILHRTVTADVRAALTVDPYAGNAYRVIGTWSGPLCAGGGGKRSHQEMSSFHRFTILPVGPAD